MRCDARLAMAPEIEGVGVDTWGVDFALLDEAGALVQNPVHYRDARTDGVPERVFRIVSAEEIYRNTGVQHMQINTLFQVFALAERHPKLLAAARHFLTMPDLLNYWLTGRITCEYTNATTTQCSIPGLASGPGRCSEARTADGYSTAGHRTRHIDRTAAARTRQSDRDRAGVSRHGFGGRGDRSRRRYGVYQLRHLVIAGHGSPAPIVTPDARAFNFTNEGGVGGTTRVLKNIMGMWLLQGCRKQWLASDYAIAGSARETAA